MPFPSPTEAYNPTRKLTGDTGPRSTPQHTSNNSPPDNNSSNAASNSIAGLSNYQWATGGAHDNQNLCNAALVGGIPADLILDWRKYNWQDWSCRLNIVVDKQAFTDWLDGGIPPDATTHARACQIWKINDRALRTFILERVSIADYDIVPDSRAIYEALRHRHQRFELHAQVLLIKEGLDIRFKPGVVPFADTSNAIRKLHARITALGPIDEDKLNDHLLTILLLNGLEELYPQLHSMINTVLDRPFSSSHDVIRCIEFEDDLQLLRAMQGLPTCIPDSSTCTLTVVGAKDKEKTGPLCANCKRSIANHLADIRVLPGGKMAGQTIEGARAARRVASKKRRNRGQVTAPIANAWQGLLF
ncbi:hypothetical protein EDB92DRAFT_2007049 [Lactarius akahatsu]|uniref:Uncharacterized protein n=1 Tax=Lactarius akahatsu TaxID=416441 RepID=A0AAD4LPH2_9AGAM|nr:hypothetical protein EDB92DRAFT_2007049 [Lactarius akahatsu]